MVLCVKGLFGTYIEHHLYILEYLVLVASFEVKLIYNFYFCPSESLFILKDCNFILMNFGVFRTSTNTLMQTFKVTTLMCLRTSTNLSV